MKEESSFILQRFRRKKTQAFASIFLFSSSLSLAQCPYFHNYFHNFLAYFALRNGKKRNGRKRKILIHAAGRASSTFPLKRPLNHNLFGPSFHCISLKMIYALFVAENFRSEIASESSRESSVENRGAENRIRIKISPTNSRIFLSSSNFTRISFENGNTRRTLEFFSNLFSIYHETKKKEE